MIAIAFLTLLVGSAGVSADDHVTHNRFRWEGPTVGLAGKSGGPKTTTAEPENVCLTDTSSCGCCLMQRNMHRMEMFFNMSLNALEHSLQETRGVLDNIRASRSAFSVALTNTRRCLGPFKSNTSVVYTHVFLNLGMNYDTETGVFVAPRSGVYSLALTVYSDSGSAGEYLGACANMMVNDRAVSVLNDNNAQDQEDSSSSVLALMLSAGDRVWVMLPAGCFLCDNENHYNTFTGFLLYTVD